MTVRTVLGLLVVAYGLGWCTGVGVALDYAAEHAPAKAARSARLTARLAAPVNPGCKGRRSP